MLVYVTSPRHAGKTFVLVADGNDTVARLFGYLLHTFYDMRVVASPFYLQHKGAFLDPHRVVKDIAGTDRNDLYLDLVETRRDLREAAAWSTEHPPFILSDAVAATLHRERKWFRRRRRILTITQTLLYFSLIVSIFVLLSYRWWAGTWPLALGLLSLYHLPQFSEIGAFTITMPPDARWWSQYTTTLFATSAFTLVATAALNTLYFLNDVCGEGPCEFRSVATLVVLWFIACIHLTVAVLGFLALSNFKRKAGDRIERLILDTGLPESAIDSCRHIGMQQFTQDYVGVCASNTIAFLSHNGHHMLAGMADQPGKQGDTTLLRIFTTVARTDQGQRALAEEGVCLPLAKGVGASAGEQHTLLLALIPRLFQAIPTRGDRERVLVELLVAMETRGTLLTGDDVAMCAVLVHTALTKELINPPALGSALDALLALLAAVHDDNDRRLLLSCFGRILRARPAVDPDLHLDIIRQLPPAIKHHDSLTRALAVAVFQLCVRSDAVLKMAMEEPDCWSALSSALDARLSAVHTHSCRCAAVLLAVAARASTHLPPPQRAARGRSDSADDDGDTDDEAVESSERRQGRAKEKKQQRQGSAASSGKGAELFPSQDGETAPKAARAGPVQVRDVLADCVKAALRFEVSSSLAQEGQQLLDGVLQAAVEDAPNQNAAHTSTNAVGGVNDNDDGGVGGAKKGSRPQSAARAAANF